MMQVSLQTEKIMPLINITLSGPAPDADTIRELQTETTRLMHDILRKEAALTVVSVAHLANACFSADGQPVDAAASLQAMITAGTNDAAEKADFIFAAKVMLSMAIGSSAAPIYVVLHEIPAESWGYDGQTQSARKAGRLIGGAGRLPGARSAWSRLLRPSGEQPGHQFCWVESALAMKCLPTRGFGTRSSNQARTSSSSPMPCM